ncbi:hypothetical protein L1987_22459 [Smallanthus sonchifolius]|uniref:Uncharacterized protein n=1 Tax=Smallanthus sonchifolius TaxID=185202 RepID=A0ACB9IGD0_9ASTR|nr:hypothetical protein L1987_22459 [Smallanthus sonchifolius]
MEKTIVVWEILNKNQCICRYGLLEPVKTLCFTLVLSICTFASLRQSILRRRKREFEKTHRETGIEMLLEFRTAFRGVVTMVTITFRRCASSLAMAIIGMVWPGASKGIKRK